MFSWFFTLQNSVLYLGHFESYAIRLLPTRSSLATCLCSECIFEAPFVCCTSNVRWVCQVSAKVFCSALPMFLRWQHCLPVPQCYLSRWRGTTSLLHGRVWEKRFYLLTHVGKYPLSNWSEVISQSSTHRLSGPGVPSRESMSELCFKILQGRALPVTEKVMWKSEFCPQVLWGEAPSPITERRAKNIALPAGSGM